VSDTREQVVSEAPERDLSAGLPSVDQLRAICQPHVLIGDLSREHWMGRLYMRRISLHLTRQLIRTRITPDAVTWGMVVSGLVAALVLTIPSIWAVVGAFVLIQVQLLLDCSDGELARWRQQSSVRGVYLDRIGHYTTDAALIIGLGVHVDGGLRSIGGWTAVGLLAAVLALIVRVETDLVHVSRSAAKLPRVETDAVAPRSQGVRRLRRIAYAIPVNRLLLSWDLSVVVLVVAVIDQVLGTPVGLQILLVTLVGVGVISVIGHLATILASDRLR
jgi:phosphatidylglycerophosphate synthase